MRLSVGAEWFGDALVNKLVDANTDGLKLIGTFADWIRDMIVVQRQNLMDCKKGNLEESLADGLVDALGFGRPAQSSKTL